MTRNHSRRLSWKGAALIGLASMVMAGCQWFNGKESEAEELVWCTVEYDDSITVNGAKAFQEMRIDFPPSQAADKADKGTVAALDWIREQVAACSYPNYENDPLDSVITFSIDEVERFAEPFVKSCGRQGLDRMSSGLREFASEGFDGSFMNMLHIELQEQTPEYLTLFQEHDVYTGGAHGGQYLAGITFSKKDGKQLGWNLFNMDKKAELIELIKAQLKKEFSADASEPITTDEQLQDLLILYDDPETPENELEYGLPLPVTAPWVTRDGIIFLYQEYEIACYAMGRPSVILSFEAVKPLLSDEGKALLNLK